VEGVEGGESSFAVGAPRRETLVLTVRVRVKARKVRARGAEATVQCRERSMC
jgi:hypothetical protein